MFSGELVGKTVFPDDDRWFWARDRIGQLAGVGKFMRPQSCEDPWTFWLNGSAYHPEAFVFLPANVPPCIDSVRPRIPCPFSAAV